MYSISVNYRVNAGIHVFPMSAVIYVPIDTVTKRHTAGGICTCTCIFRYLLFINKGVGTGAANNFAPQKMIFSS